MDLKDRARERDVSFKLQTKREEEGDRDRDDDEPFHRSESTHHPVVHNPVGRSFNLLSRVDILLRCQPSSSYSSSSKCLLLLLSNSIDGLLLLRLPGDDLPLVLIRVDVLFGGDGVLGRLIEGSERRSSNGRIGGLRDGRDWTSGKGRRRRRDDGVGSRGWGFRRRSFLSGDRLLSEETHGFGGGGGGSGFGCGCRRDLGCRREGRGGG